MKFRIKHENKTRLRLRCIPEHFTFQQADILQYSLSQDPHILEVKVREKNADIIILHDGQRDQVLETVRTFSFAKAEVPSECYTDSGREMSSAYYDKLVSKVAIRYGSRLLLPVPVRHAIILLKSVRYLSEGIRTLMRRRLEVPVLDATAIGVSIWQGDYDTASSVMFLLGIGELLEEWTHKKSVSDLARSMSLNVGKVWKIVDGQEVSVRPQDVETGDQVVIHVGNVIPFDGIVLSGEAMVNQASLTGESVPVVKKADAYVYAGTVIEEGNLIIQVKENKGASRYDKIIRMIDESEKLKSELESKAEHLADRLVPYSFIGTGLTYLLTRNVTRAISILMVDYSCALKLAMPVSVLSAIREASNHQITVKGGKFLEAMSEADTIVFDKTGTLTEATPTVVKILSFNGEDEDELLRVAACMEEHFPHSMAKAVTDAALKRQLEHEEMHSKIEYIVAHGISSMIDGQRVLIGSYHFIFEDEGCKVPEGKEALMDTLTGEYSYLYMSRNGELAAVLCIEDPVKEEMKDIIRELKQVGISHIVMMTGDSRKTAERIAAQIGIDQVYAEVLPADKAGYVEQQKKEGHKVIMIGDGINDSPALSAADVGIAINDGAEIAREIADITIGGGNLYELVTLKRLSDALMKRIQGNYHKIVTINSALIGLGALGIIAPTTSALFHNSSTLLITLNSMKDLL